MSNGRTLWLDIETTGKAKAYDQIVQVGYAWENEEGRLVDEEKILVKPSVPISRGAFETHGISDDDVANSPTFAQAALELADRIENAGMIGTYNGNRFDIPILDAEFRRADMSVDLTSKLPLDGLRMLQEMNPRDLSTMHEQYVGKPLEGAHDALADIRGTHALYRSMKSAFGLDAIPDHQIAHHLKGLNITVDGKLTWDKWNPDVIILNYGKYAGRPIEWVIENDPEYLRWIIYADKERFDSITVELVEIAQMALNGTNAFYQWVQSTYGDPPTEIHELRQTVGQQSRPKPTGSGSCPQCGGPTHQYPIFGGDPNDPDLVDVDVVCERGCDIEGFLLNREAEEEENWRHFMDTYSQEVGEATAEDEYNRWEMR